MRLSTKSRFALNALIDLGLRESAGPVALATIAARQRISLSYLEQLFARMRRQSLVESTRGPGGGYSLARRPDAITLADIVDAVEDPVVPGGDATGALWASLDAVMLRHMATIPLSRLIDEQRVAGTPVETRSVRRPLAPQPPAQRPGTTAPNSVFALAGTLRAGS